MPGLARIKSVCRESSCSECEYGASVVRVGEQQKEGEMKLSSLYWTRQGKLTADSALIRTWRADPAGNILAEINGSSVWLRTCCPMLLHILFLFLQNPLELHCAIHYKKEKIQDTFLPYFTIKIEKSVYLPMFALHVTGTARNKANIPWTVVQFVILL